MVEKIGEHMIEEAASFGHDQNTENLPSDTKKDIEPVAMPESIRPIVEKPRKTIGRAERKPTGSEKESGRPSILETVSFVSKTNLAESAKLLAAKVENIPQEECVLLLVKMMERFMTEEANDAVPIRGLHRGRGKIGLADDFAEFQSSKDHEKQTIRYMVEMVMEEWALATGRHIISKEDSQMVNEAIRTISIDTEKGFFSKIFGNKKTKTDIIKAVQSVSLELEEMRQKLNHLKLKEAEVVQETAEIPKKALSDAEALLKQAKNEADAVRQNAKEEAREMIQNAKTSANEVVANGQISAEKIQKEREKIQMEVVDLKRIRDELSANPGIAKIYENKHGREIRREELARKLDDLMESYFNSTEYDKIISDVQDLLEEYPEFLDTEKINLLHIVYKKMDNHRNSLARWIKHIKKYPQKIYEEISLFYPKITAKELPEFEQKSLDFIYGLLSQGADKGWVAVGLAGLDSKEAWTMRKTLLSQGADKGWVAVGLAGLDSKEAWTMRETLLSQGADKGLVAVGLAGLDSKEAWTMRKTLLSQGADKGWVAEGLAGLDSKEAWTMRETLLSQGADKGLVARGLVGYCTTFIWRLKLKKEEEKAHK